LISNENDREFISYPTKLFLQLGERFIIGWVANIESFDLKGREYCLQCWKITLENDLTGLAILGIEEIDLDRGGLLGHSMNSPGKESNTKNKNH
jgi:hypothetical protein